MITPCENMLKVFRHEMPEWIPVITMVDNYQVPRGMDEELASNLNCVTFSKKLGLDIMERYEEARYEKMGEVRRYEMPIFKEKYHNVSFKTELDGDMLQRTWETPHGTIRALFRSVTYDVGIEAAVATEFPVEYPIKAPEDFAAFRDIFEDLEYEVVPEGVIEMEKRKKVIGDEGIFILWAPSSPLGMAVRYFMGVEFLTNAYCYHRVELEELLNIIGEKFLQKQRLLADLDCDGTNNADDTTTLAISPRMFEELEIPYLQRASKINHDQGKLYLHHSCGHIHDLLDLYTETGMDAVDILTVEPVGNCTIADAKRRLDPKVAMIPGFELGAINSGDVERMRTMVKSYFEDGRPGDNFMPVLFPQPNNSTMEQMEIVAEEAKKYQHMVG